MTAGSTRLRCGGRFCGVLALGGGARMGRLSVATRRQWTRAEVAKLACTVLPYFIGSRAVVHPGRVVHSCRIARLECVRYDLREARRSARLSVKRVTVQNLHGGYWSA
ncbi:hypothetical protein PHLGIDRAFT_206632 [Phlebiopsis gigantea 11061_1 CR5-6]|uniref:Uncharacterized protein n=1 Tax=Phlebiopsis gigantea (strain 11061_1 CR5-6) TaxID=745531 RepID=A0A0C3S6H6_PHLG1|nr:hypothetical protein PHLGIDRAFT_206632 [Phlebiopsis gigantea 11061_1 CR5-6]